MVSQNSVNETSNFNLSSTVALFVNSKWKQTNWRIIVQNVLKYILQVHENYSNNPLKLILFSFGDKKRKT